MKHLNSQAEIIKLASLKDEQLLEDYNRNKLKKISNPLRIKIYSDKWLLQRIKCEDELNVGTFILLKVIIKIEKIYANSFISHKQKEIEITRPYKDVYLDLNYTIKEWIEELKPQLGYVQCYHCNKYIYGDEPRLEKERWYCKSCYERNFY